MISVWVFVHMCVRVVCVWCVCGLCVVCVFCVCCGYVWCVCVVECVWVCVMDVCVCGLGVYVYGLCGECMCVCV